MTNFSRLIFCLLLATTFAAPAQAWPKYGLWDGCVLAARLLTGGRGPRRLPSRYDLRNAMKETVEQVDAELQEVSPELHQLAMTDGLDANWRRDLVLFARELKGNGLSPKELYTLFRQNESLYSGDFAKSDETAKPGIANDFLRAFWTPKTAIVGALEKENEIAVYTHRDYEVSVGLGLPHSYRGKPVKVVATNRESSIVDPRWLKHHKDNYYHDKPVLLLTGATSGLGLAMAKRLVDSGEFRLVLTGRASSLEGLRKAGITEGPNVIIRPLDVANKDQRAAVLNEVTEKWGGVDTLVNNASITTRGPLEITSEETIRQQMEVDFFGPLALTQGVVPLMRLRGRGHIMNVSSANGQVALPLMGGYAAAKAAGERTSEALAGELKPFGVKVSIVQPGLFASDGIAKIGAHAGPEKEYPVGHPYLKHVTDMNDFMKWNLERTAATTDSVADKLVAQLRKDNPKPLIRPTMEGFGLLKMREYLPYSLFHGIMRRWIPNYRNWGEIDPIPRKQ